MSAHPEIVRAEVIPPPVEMVDMMVMQLETVLTTIKCPDYVDESAKNFIAAMKRWAAEGK